MISLINPEFRFFTIYFDFVDYNGFCFLQHGYRLIDGNFAFLTVDFDLAS